MTCIVFIWITVLSLKSVVFSRVSHNIKITRVPNFSSILAIYLAGDERIELPPKVLETPIIPFDQSPTLFTLYIQNFIQIIYRKLLVSKDSRSISLRYISLCFATQNSSWTLNHLCKQACTMLSSSFIVFLRFF